MLMLRASFCLCYLYIRILLFSLFAHSRYVTNSLPTVYDWIVKEMDKLSEPNCRAWTDLLGSFIRKPQMYYVFMGMVNHTLWITSFCSSHTLSLNVSTWYIPFKSLIPIVPPTNHLTGVIYSTRTRQFARVLKKSIKPYIGWSISEYKLERSTKSGIYIQRMMLLFGTTQGVV